MSQDHYAKGQELSKAGIYQILAEEAWRDGEVSGADSELLEGFRKYLRLTNERAMQILDVAEEKYRSQTIGRLRDFSPTHCFARALRYAYGDAEELSEKEQKYLQGLAAAVGLSEKDQTSIQARLEAKGWRPGPGRQVDDSLKANLEEMAAVGENLLETDKQPALKADDLVPDSLPPPPPPEELPAEKVQPAGSEPEASEPEAPEPSAAEAGAAADDGDPAAPSEPDRETPEDDPPAPSPEAAPDAGEAEDEDRPRRKKRQRRDGDGDGDEDEDPVYRAKGRRDRPDDDEDDAPPPRKRRKKRRRKPTPGPDATLSGRKRKKRKRRRKKSRDDEAPPAPTAPTLFERIPSTARIMLLVGVLTGVMLLVLPALMPSGPGIDPNDPPGATVSSRYKELEELHGKAAYKVKRLEVRGPDPPDGPALDLGEAWDLFAGRDGFLYGTSLYRIFRIDPRSGRAEWVAGSGLLGEPQDGQVAKEAAMDPADPRVDAAGRLYFRQGNTAIFRVDAEGKLYRLLGSVESRQPWEDGTPAREARPGAIEQIALGAGGRLYFDEYSGESRGPEILGRIEPGDKLRAMFLFSMESIEHPYRRLVKSYVGAGNGFENLVIGEDGAVYFAVGKRLYRWRPGQGPPTLLMPEAPLEFTVDRDGAVIAIRETRIERWYDLDKWTRENRFVELVAGVEDGISTATEVIPLPGTAVAYHQPRSLTIGPDGVIYVLDGTVGGTGRARPRIDMLKRADSPR